MGIAIGIDLGTTNSCVAVVQAGRARVVEDRIGRRVHPSVVAFNELGDSIAGHDAKDHQLVDPENTIFCAKRLIGQDLNSNEMREFIRELPYTVAMGPDKIPVVKVFNKEVSLPEISALMLRHLRQMCNEMLGIEVSDAVITVPANFNDVQRSMTKVAGRIAGFNVLRILNEPTAAALAYGFGGKRAEKIAVYDFGGGTFDITIVELADDIYEVLSTAGDTYLGGEDFDKVIISEMVEMFKKKHKVDLSKDTNAMQRIRSVAEKVKCQLSAINDVQATLQGIGEDKRGESLDFHFRLTRQRFEEMVASLVDKSLLVCDEALRLAGLDRTGLDNLVMVGGTTRVPLVRKRVAEHFGIVPRTEINPDEVVAIGAAIQAFSLTGQQLPKELPKPTPPPRPSIPFSSKAPPSIAPRGAGLGQPRKNPVAQTIHMLGRSSTKPKGAPTQRIESGLKSSVPAGSPVDDDMGLAVKRTAEKVKLDDKETGLAVKKTTEKVKLDDKDMGLAVKKTKKAKLDDKETGLTVKKAPTKLGIFRDKDMGLAVKKTEKAKLDDKETGLTVKKATKLGIFRDRDMGLTVKKTAEKVKLDDKETGLTVKTPATPPEVQSDRSTLPPPAIKSIEPEPEVKPLDTDSEVEYPDLDVKPLEPEADLDMDSQDSRPEDEPPSDFDMQINAPDLDMNLDHPLPDDENSKLEARSDEFGEIGLGAIEEGNGSEGRFAEAVSDSLPAVLAGSMEDVGRTNLSFPPPSGETSEPPPDIASEDTSESSQDLGFGEIEVELPSEAPFSPLEPEPSGPADADIDVNEEFGSIDTGEGLHVSEPIRDEVQPTPGADQPARMSEAPQRTSIAVPDNVESRSALLLDVTPRALGVAVAGGFCDIIIERNAAIPVEQSRLFTTSHDNQTQVAVDIYQGEGRRIEDNIKLGQVFLTNVRPAPRGEIKVRVTFEIDTDGILGVSAHNEESDEAQRTKIVLSGGMDDDKVEELVQKYAE